MKQVKKYHGWTRLKLSSPGSKGHEIEHFFCTTHPYMFGIILASCCWYYLEWYLSYFIHDLKSSQKSSIKHSVETLAMEEVKKGIHVRIQKTEPNKLVKSALKGGTWYPTGAVASLVTLLRKQEASVWTKPLPAISVSISTWVILNFPF